MRHRMLVKLASIAVLALILLIPLALLMPVVHERAALRDGAVGEIEQDWGRAQTIVGPILVLPLEQGYAYAFPDELQVTGDVEPQERSRGIYSAVVYSARFAISGSFHRPTPTELGVPAETVHWDQAYVALAVTDLRGTATQVSLRWGTEARPMLPGSLLARWPSGLHASVPVGTAPIAFSLDLPVHGSEGVRFAPLGVHNEVSLRSGWPNPRFTGAFLPASRDITDEQFAATWSVSYYGRDFGQHARELPAAIDASLFGVDLLPGIDSYRSVDRAVKYGVLFVVLAFMSWFLFEVIARVRIHPFQYAMVGLSLGVFFLVLLALSELVPFVAAYSVASAGTIGLVTTYMLPVLKTGRRTFVATGLLSGSFAILYVVLQAEDFALLAGSLVVFVALAITMRLTRRLDWYADDTVAPTDAASS
ncbi:MAG: cell envelope integrity protein CreD [Kofleriaceae bacterium]|nr:cell envelope integrity protein CreD [Kofleriaceae bacterium]